MTKKFENAIKAVRPNNRRNGVIPYHYDMDLEDMASLFEMVYSGQKDGLYHAINSAFEYGFVMGNRCTHRRNIQRL